MILGLACHACCKINKRYEKNLRKSIFHVDYIYYDRHPYLAPRDMPAVPADDNLEEFRRSMSGTWNQRRRSTQQARGGHLSKAEAFGNSLKR